MRLIFAIATALVFSACAGENNSRKVLIMTSGKAEVNGDAITLQPGTTHNEIFLTPKTDSITVTSPQGTHGYSVKEPGLYLLNLKKDTIVGGYQRTGSDDAETVISQDDLRFRIDSLYKLMHAYNVSEEARNFNLPPFHISRISGNLDAQIVGPYRKLPTSFDPSKEHEVYKFYTNKEAMDIIMRLVKMLKRS